MEYTDAGKKKLIKYVTQCNIIGEARETLGKTNIDTYEDLEEIFRLKFSSSITAASIREQLIATTQGRCNIKDFADKVSNLTRKLTKLEIAEEKIISEELKTHDLKRNETLAVK